MFDTKQNTSATSYHIISIRPHIFYCFYVILLLRRACTIWATAFDCGSVDTILRANDFKHNTVFTVFVVLKSIGSSASAYHIIIVIIIRPSSPGSSCERGDIFACQFLFSKTVQSRVDPNDDKSTFEDYIIVR